MVVASKETFVLLKLYLSLLFSAVHVFLLGRILKTRTHRLCSVLFFSEVLLGCVFHLWELVIVHIPVVGSYMVMRVFRTRLWMPWLLLICNLAYLSVFQLYEFTSPMASQDWVTQRALLWTLRILTIHLSSAGWYFHDCITTPGDNDDKRGVEKAGNSVPVSWVEFLAFSIFFPTLISGPGMTIEAFQEFLNRQGPPKEAGRMRRIWVLLLGTHVFLALAALVRLHFSQEWLSSDWFQGQSLFRRWFMAWLSAVHVRLILYSIWLGSETSMVIMGLGLVIKDNSICWDGMTNVDIYSYETHPSALVVIASWNFTVIAWLKNSVYRRLQGALGLRSSSTSCQLVTFVVSALWHGIFPGYYMFFLTLAWISIVTQSKPPILTKLYVTFSVQA